MDTWTVRMGVMKYSVVEVKLTPCNFCINIIEYNMHYLNGIDSFYSVGKYNSYCGITIDSRLDNRIDDSRLDNRIDFCRYWG